MLGSRTAAALAVSTTVVCVDFCIRRGTAPVKSTAKHFESSAFCSADLPLRFRRSFYDQVGVHPADGHALNAIEQVNQTWTYLAAIAAARQLLLLHPEAGPTVPR